MENEEINPGGINGSGKGVVNTNSEDYKALQQAAQKQTPEEKRKYGLLALKFRMESNVITGKQ